MISLKSAGLELKALKYGEYQEYVKLIKRKWGVVMSKSDSEFPSAVGFSRDVQEEEDAVLTERDLKQKQRFQQAMLAQKIKRNAKAAPNRPIDAPVNRKKKGEYFQLPMGERDDD